MRGALPSPTHTGSYRVSQLSIEPNYPHNTVILSTVPAHEDSIDLLFYVTM
jgi:hypothetical protein